MTTTEESSSSAASQTEAHGAYHEGAGEKTETISSESYAEHGGGGEKTETISSESYAEHGGGGEKTETISSESYAEHGGGGEKTETISSESYAEHGGGGEKTETISSESYAEHTASEKTGTICSESYAEHEGGGGSSSETHEVSTTESQKPSVMLSQEELQASLGSVPKYGVDVGVAQATGSEKCRFKEGYDQPAEYDMLDKPLILASSFLCCDACKTNPGPL